jgi:hypothetical protein
MEAASPTKYIGKDFAPTIFIHGTADTTVPMSSSIDFFTSSMLQACRHRSRSSRAPLTPSITPHWTPSRSWRTRSTYSSIG